MDCQRQPAGRVPWTVRVNPNRGLQMTPYNSHHLGTMFHSRFLISNPDSDWFAPALVSLVDLPTCRWRGGKGAKGPAPLVTSSMIPHPLGLSMPSRQIGAGIINLVQTPIGPPGPGGCRLPGRLRVTGCSPSAGSHTPSMA